MCIPGDGGHEGRHLAKKRGFRGQAEASGPELRGRARGGYAVEKRAEDAAASLVRQGQGVVLAMQPQNRVRGYGRSVF